MSSVRWSWRAVLPHLVVACWVLYLAVTIWQHALASGQTPWGDALDYLQKAASFWQAVEGGGRFNPLDLVPTIRPAGTVLMTHPFGFSPDYRGFHFRSIFLPILFTIIAVYVAAGMKEAKSKGSWLAAIALLFSSLPLFYRFDWNTERWHNYGWGMVDGFQAGVAALAGAALVRSILARSLTWLLVAAFLIASTFLIKQSGLTLMAVFGVTWLLTVALDWRSASSDERRRLRAYGLIGAAQIAAVYAAVIAWCLSSEYLSGANFSYAMQALGFYRGASSSPSLSLFHDSIGEAWVLWLIAVVIVFMRGSRAGGDSEGTERSRARALLLGSVLIWTLGLAYWLLIQGGGTQIRYFYPFLLMGAACAIPAALYAWPPANGWARRGLMVIALLPALNIGLLLAAGDSPPHRWQAVSGVSVSVGRDREAVKQAYAFLDQVRKGKKEIRVFFFPNTVPEHEFVFVGRYEKIVRPQLTTFEPINPMDWTHGFIVRVNDVLDSDYVLVRKLSPDAAAGHFDAKRFATFFAEIDAFDAWMSTLGANDGVEVVQDGADVRLLRVADRAALSRRIDQFVALHDWRPEFVAANQQAWWSADALPESARNALAKNLVFSDIYRIDALAAKRDNANLLLDIWWEELRHEPANGERFLFLHLVNDAGEILLKDQIALFPFEPPDARRRLRHGRVTFNTTHLREKPRWLGFGVYRTSGEFLVAPGGKSDYGGKRILVPIDDPGGAARTASGALRP